VSSYIYLLVYYFTDESLFGDRRDKLLDSAHRSTQIFRLLILKQSEIVIVSDRLGASVIQRYRVTTSPEVHKTEVT